MLFTVFQMLVGRWIVRAFGEDVAKDRAERTHRFLEEALELAQSTGCTQDQAHALVEYVYGRPQGAIGQEVGGTLLTLAALCEARSISMNVEAVAELNRVNRPEMLEKIRLKQEAKKRDIPLGSPLPGSVSLDTECLVTGKKLGDVLDAPPAEPAPTPQPEKQRTHTDAVGTNGGKATVARPI